MSEEITTAGLPEPFNRLIGTWYIQRHIHDDEGTGRMLEGEVAFASSFGGYAAQDHWTVPGDHEWIDGSPNGGFRGTTLYYFDDLPGVVHSVWIDPDHHTSLRFSGSMDASGFVLTSTEAAVHARWHLQLITEVSATWHAYRSDSADGPWNLWEVMQLTRLEAL